jgi:site-specific recombinase XerD
MNPAVITMHRKGNKVSQVPMMNNTKSLLTPYMEIRKFGLGMADAENYLFVKQKQN